jgi:plasmid stability protein
MLMKRITTTIDDETYRLLQLRAAESGISVSSMVRQVLISNAKKYEERTIRHSIRSFSANGRLSRDELYDTR